MLLIKVLNIKACGDKKKQQRLTKGHAKASGIKSEKLGQTIRHCSKSYVIRPPAIHKASTSPSNHPRSIASVLMTQDGHGQDIKVNKVFLLNLLFFFNLNFADCMAKLLIWCRSFMPQFFFGEICMWFTKGKIFLHHKQSGPTRNDPLMVDEPF